MIRYFVLFVIKNSTDSFIIISKLFLFQHDIEMAAEEHDAYQKSVDNKFNQLKVEARTIQTEIQNFEKNRHPRLDKNVLNGNQSLFDLVNFHEKDFVNIWQSRKVLITRSARFSIFKTDCNNIEKRLDEIIDTIHVKLILDNVDSRPLLSIGKMHALKSYDHFVRDILAFFGGEYQSKFCEIII